MNAYMMQHHAVYWSSWTHLHRCMNAESVAEDKLKADTALWMSCDSSNETGPNVTLWECDVSYIVIYLSMDRMESVGPSHHIPLIQLYWEHHCNSLHHIRLSIYLFISVLTTFKVNCHCSIWQKQSPQESQVILFNLCLYYIFY